MSYKPNPNVTVFEEVSSQDVIKKVKQGACVKSIWENASGELKNPKIDLKNGDEVFKYKFNGSNGVSEFKKAKNSLSEMNDVLCE